MRQVGDIVNECEPLWAMNVVDSLYFNRRSESPCGYGRFACSR